MKLPLKYIVALVITALVGIFAYQAYWLVGLYHSQKTAMDNKIQELMATSHYGEMGVRIDKMRKDKNGPHGEISSSAYYSPKKDEHQLDTLRIKEKDLGKAKIDRKKRNGVHTEVRYDKGANREKETQSENLRLMISGKLTTLMQQALFSKLNELSQLDIHVYDSVLTVKLQSDSLLLASDGKAIPHRVQFLRGKKVVAQVSSKLPASSSGEGQSNIKMKEYFPSSDAVKYQYVVSNEGEPNEEKYVLTIEPMTMAVLSQMAGILATSLFIMLILAFAFWYLIHTMLKQKTLDAMKSDFTNNITHELKTPIAVAYAANDALLNYGMMNNPEKARKYLGIAQKQLQQLSGMVEQILSMSMERRKNMLLNMEEVSVKEVIEPLIAQHQLKASKKVEVSFTVEPENLMVRADRMHFSNIVSNLIDNAIKYSGDEVKIVIKASLGSDSSSKSQNVNSEDMVIITVEDNGIGIAHAKLPYIFDKFYRVTDGNKYSVKGYGLGLFYVKSLMEKMGGSVSVESELGKGTCFELKLKG